MTTEADGPGELNEDDAYRGKTEVKDKFGGVLKESNSSKTTINEDDEGPTPGGLDTTADIL
jgi:hypothetical protein